MKNQKAPFAKFLSNDQYHEQAVRVWDKLKQKGEACFTSNFVLDETFTLLGRRAGYDFAAQRANHIYSSRVLTIFRPEETDEVKAIKYFRKYSDPSVSFTDCISFVLMKKRKIARVFTFDRHFEQVGYRIYNK